MRRIAFSIAILAMLTGILALVTGAFRPGGAVMVGNAKDIVGPARYPPTLAGPGGSPWTGTGFAEVAA